VKKGGEKVFRYFLEVITGETKGKKSNNVNRRFYEELISKIILFKELENIHGQGKRAIGQIRSAVIPYSISVLYLYTDGAKSGKQFDLLKIWKQEKLEDDLVVFFTELMKLMNELIKKYSKSDDFGEYSKNKNLWDVISISYEIREFILSKIAQDILIKYAIPNNENKNEEQKEVDFERIQMNIEILSKGMGFYNQLRKIYNGLSEAQGNKLDIIISSIINFEDLSEEMINFENNLMTNLRKNSPIIFDQIDITRNHLLEGTLKFIILKYNEAIERGIGLIDFFKAIEKKSLAEKRKYTSVFNTIALNLSKGIAPSVKDVELASNYFKEGESEKSTPVISDESVRKIDLNILKQMVEWDSRMKILKRGELAYVADLAYELKPLNKFHKTIAQKHLETLLLAGFEIS
jgi:hypothetical protein